MSFIIKDVDLRLLNQLNDEDLYNTCTSNHYFLNLCRQDPTLMNRFNHYRQLLHYHPEYLMLLKGINPETNRRIIKNGPLYRGLMDKYAPY